MSAPVFALTPELERLVAAQERFEKLREHHLRRTGGKLHDLAYANAHEGPPEAVREAIRQALDADRVLGLQYTPYGGATVPRRLIAHGLRRTHGHRFTHREVVLTPGAMAALHLVMRAAFRGAGDEAVIVTPTWLDTPLYAAERGFRPVLVPVAQETCRLDVGAIEGALTPRTRLVVLSQPANPTGVLYDEAELRALADVLSRQPEPPLLLSDECHRDYLFGGASFVAPSAFYDRTCFVYSFGKRLLIQGQRTGYVAVTPALAGEGLADLLRRLCRVMGFCTPTALMQRALPRLLEASVPLSPVERRRQGAVQALRDAGYEVAPGEHTLFVYARVPHGCGAFDHAERAAAKGTLVLPSPLFHQEGHMRLSMTATDEMVDRGLEVLADLGRGGP